MLKILLHVCCGPCGIYPIEKLKDTYQVSVFYYNPNIHPEEEYLKRKQAVIDYCLKNSIEFIEENYDPNDYFSAVNGQEENKVCRCPLCYKLRLNKTAAYAAKNNFFAFTSTLLISPHQNINLIKEIGNNMAKKYNICFYTAEPENNKKKYKGFRPGFSYGRQKAKEENMYRQHYCGCVFSQNEV